MPADALTFDMVDAIVRTRDGEELTDAEIRVLIERYVSGEVPDYQMAAWAMAVVFRGLSARATATLTQAMVDSGETVDLSRLGRRIVDKHSTGGVGDKVSLALAPIVAACGVPFAKMSGRGLGHTGGTLDKLESIPGFTVELSQEAFLAQVERIGVAVVGQTADICPADKRLYGLRDVTGTVDSIPLIAASIMSKKLAAGADAIVLDVKVGSGAFMKDLASARQLADTMIGIGEAAGREVRVLLTDMSTPLGRAVGNALEIEEVRSVLRGERDAPGDLVELVTTAAAVLLSLSDLGVSEAEGRDRVAQVIASGAAHDKYEEWISAQGGDPRAALPVASVQFEVAAPVGGTIIELDALTVGKAAASLGAGRQRAGEAIDHSVGVQLVRRRGESVDAGDVMLVVHARSADEAERAAARILEGVVIADNGGQEARPVLLERRGGEGDARAT